MGNNELYYVGIFILCIIKIVVMIKGSKKTRRRIFMADQAYGAQLHQMDVQNTLHQQQMGMQDMAHQQANSFNMFNNGCGGFNGGCGMF